MLILAGLLQFLSLLNSSTLAPGGVYSERISTKGGFKFGDQTVSHVYVSVLHSQTILNVVLFDLHIVARSLCLYKVFQ